MLGGNGKKEGYSSQDTPLWFRTYSDVSIGSEILDGALLTQAWFDEDDKFEYLYETWGLCPAGTDGIRP